MKMAGLKLSLCLMLLLIFGIGCSYNQNNEETPDSTVNSEAGEIELSVKSMSKNDTGIDYSITMTNNTASTILQNNVYLSYPIKLSNGTKMNALKIEASGNKLNIKPGESVELTVFVPIESYENQNNTDKSNPMLEIEGYFDKLDSANKFEKDVQP